MTLKCIVDQPRPKYIGGTLFLFQISLTATAIGWCAVSLWGLIGRCIGVAVLVVAVLEANVPALGTNAVALHLCHYKTLECTKYWIRSKFICLKPPIQKI